MKTDRKQQPGRLLALRSRPWWVRDELLSCAVSSPSMAAAGVIQQQEQQEQEGQEGQPGQENDDGGGGGEGAEEKERRGRERERRYRALWEAVGLLEAEAQALRVRTGLPTRAAAIIAEEGRRCVLLARACL